MPLFGGKKPTLTVTVEPDQALPGQAVNVRVDLEGELDDKVRGVSAGVECLNHYSYEYRDHDGDQHTRNVTETIHEQAVPLAPDGRPQPGQHTVAVSVPAGVAPSADRVVTWQAWAKVDRPGRDVNEKAPLTVLAAPELRAVDAQSAPGSEAAAEVRFDGLSARSLRPGDRLTGTLTVTPREGVKVTEVRVEARAYKTSHSRHGTLMAKLQDVTQTLAGAGELAVGQSQSWPFSLAIPPDAVPSLQTQFTTVRWQLVGVLARRMRSDHMGWVDLHVHH